LIQGPPGTGKSHLICNGVLPQAVNRGERVLVVCNSNQAVDALVSKTYKANKALQKTILRCGFKDYIMAEVKDLGVYAEAADKFDGLESFSAGSSDTSDFTVQGQIRSKQVCFTTIHWASKDKQKNEATPYWRFDTLVVDEAAQIEDCKLFIVLARCPELKKVVLVGDPRQLQPYVPDSIRERGYGISTMERLMDRVEPPSGCITHVMLDIQWRMAASLREIISVLYYEKKLTDAEVVKTHGPKQGLAWTPLVLIDLQGGKCEYSPLHRSFANELEANLVAQVYFFVKERLAEIVPAENLDGFEENQTCVLTPFNRHKDLLRMKIADIPEERLENYAVFADRSHVSQATPSSVAASQLSDAGDDKAAVVQNIDTVDKFQGSERAAVIISGCVDTKPLRAADPHFINVACSRAKHVLIVCGNFTALRKSQDWSAIYTHAERYGRVLRVVSKDVEGQEIGEILKRNLLQSEETTQPRKRPRR
jgi:hypothetical protein